MILQLVFAAQLLTQATDDFDYGEVYFAETQTRSLPRLSVTAGYGFNISNSFLELNSAMASSQLRIWKYFSTGVFGLINKSGLSPAGEQIRRLESVDINVKIPSPRWGVFSLSYLQFMLGRWNILNLFPLESELLFGGGAGILNRGKDTSGEHENKFSYLWSVEHRFIFSEHMGLFISVLGHLDTAYLQSGLIARFN